MTKLNKCLISLFILFNFLTMLRVHVPLHVPLFKTIYKPVDAYLSYFSIYQDWVMFSPNPARTSSYLSADIVFNDGTKEHYVFPKASEQTFLQKYSHGEKFRKIISEGIRNDDHSYMWKDTARFALRKMREKSFHKIPLKVHLNRHWKETPDLHAEWRPHGDQSSPYNSFRFYTFEVL